jgi:hypothetical protein
MDAVVDSRRHPDNQKRSTTARTTGGAIPTAGISRT